MKILLINEVCGITSTGRICAEIARHFEEEGHEVKIAFGRNNVIPGSCKTYAVRIGNNLNVYSHAAYSRLTDKQGFASKTATRRFIKWADAYDPDFIWLHNLHGYYINVEILFEWLKKRRNTKIQWTLHDCWPITGHCVHFSYIGCERWKTGCLHCPQKSEYPKSMFADNSKANYRRKKRIFTDVKNMTIITPSQWLANIVSQSFLKSYPIEIQYNTVNKAIFCPTKSDFRERYHIVGKKVILGVANIWGKRKGLQDFVELAGLLNETYAIILVGLIPGKVKKFPERIITINKTNDAKELACIYSASDIYINASREETFGMTTLEAISCGTQVIVYKGTACEEVLEKNEGHGIAVEYGVKNLLQGIKVLERV